MRNKLFAGFLLFLLLALFAFGIFFFFDMQSEFRIRKNIISDDSKTLEDADDFDVNDDSNTNNDDIKENDSNEKTENPQTNKSDDSADEKPKSSFKLNGEGTIKGIVYYQEYYDEKENEGGMLKPLEGVKIHLLDKIHTEYSMPAFVFNILTDDRGEFKIEKIPVGEFTLQAEKIGYASKIIGNYRIRANESYHVEIIMRKGFEIHGIVSDKKKNKIEGAQVLAVKIDMQQNQQVLLPVVTSDNEGKYRIYGLSKGQYYLEASHAAYTTEKQFAQLSESKEINFTLDIGGGIRGVVLNPDQLPVQEFQAKAYLFGSSDMWDAFLQAGSSFSQAFKSEEGRFEIGGLKAGNYVLEVFSKQYAKAVIKNIKVETGKFTEVTVNLTLGAVLIGKVLVKESNIPVVEARVSLAKYVNLKYTWNKRQVENEQTIPFQDSSEYATFTDAEGNFMVTGIPLKKRDVIVSHSDYPNIKESIDFSKGGEVQKTFYLEGQTARIHGIVKDTRGNPCKGYRVALNVGGNPFGGAQNLTATTDDFGKYEIKNIPPRSYMVIVVRGFFSILEMTSINLKAGDDLEVNFGIEGGVIVVGDVKLNGKGIANAFLTFSPLNPRGQMRTATTNEKGYYEVSGIVPGKYSVAVVIMNMAEMRNPKHSRFCITVPDVKEHRFDVKVPLGSIFGMVKSKEDNEPIKRGQVFLEAAESKGDASNFVELASIFGGQARIGNDGKFQFKNVAPAKYRLRVYVDGHSTYFQNDVIVLPDMDIDVGTIFLNKHTEISGIVTDELGTAIEGANVTVKDNQGRSLTMIFGERSNKDGKFTLKGLYEGKFFVTAVATGFQKATKTVTISADPVVNVSIQLTGACMFDIQVTDHNGNGVPNAQVEVKDSKGKTVTPHFFFNPGRGGGNIGNLNPYLTDAAGRMTRDNLSPGTYTIIVTKGGFSTNQVKITLNKGAANNVSIILYSK